MINELDKASLILAYLLLDQRSVLATAGVDCVASVLAPLGLRLGLEPDCAFLAALVNASVDSKNEEGRPWVVLAGKQVREVEVLAACEAGLLREGTPGSESPVELLPVKEAVGD